MSYNIYRNYMYNLRNLFPGASIPVSSPIPQSQPVVETDATIAIEKAFAIRYEIMKAIVAKNRF